LSQEDKKLLEMVERYVKELGKTPEKEKEVIVQLVSVVVPKVPNTRRWDASP
jgi:hypothetical protein